jgi:voltage-gated potassium channel
MMPILLRRFVRSWLRNPPPAIRIVALLLAILCYGASGFLYFELPAKPDLGWLDAFWWSLVTITTIGYGDYFPSSTGGRFLVAAPVMLFGIGLLGYVLSLAASALVEAKTRALRGLGSMKLRQHLVVVNFPTLSKVAAVIDELRHANALGPDVPIVLIDADLEELPAELERRHVHFVRGAPARDDTLERAAVEQATWVVVLAKRPGNSESDHENLAVILAIETLHRSAKTVVECVDESSVGLFHKAGCDSVVCASRFDVHLLGSELVHSGTQAVIDELLDTLTGEQLFFTPFEGSEPTTFERLATRCQKLEHIAIGIRDGKQAKLRPSNAHPVNPGDAVISIGAKRIKLGAAT